MTPIDQDTILGAISIIFVAFPISIAMARWLWRRSGPGSVAPPLQGSVESNQRLERLEQSVDAIAIEVERVSENVRYLTKVLAEPRPNAAVGPGEPPQRH